MKNLILAWTTLLILVSCGTHQPVVGYEGPLPTSASRQACLTPIMGKPLAEVPVEFGEGDWIVTSFLVGGEPWVHIEHGAHGEPDFVRKFVIVHNDGDVEDLYWRVTGEHLAAYQGELSKAYKQSMGL